MNVATLRREPMAETAAEHLVTRVPRARPGDTVRSTLSGILGDLFDSTEAVFVVDEAGHLEGLVRLRDLLAVPPDRTLGEVMTAKPQTVRPEEDQERVAVVAITRNVPVVPVVDAEDRLLGAVPPEALIEVLRREHVEDLDRRADLRREDLRARVAIEAPPARRVRDRLPWLLVGLLGSAVATFVVSRFEEAIGSRVAIAFFIPAIVYLADAIGTQTETVAVRGLSRSHIPLPLLLAGELRTGLIIGLVLGGLSFPAVWAAFGDLHLAAAVALSIVTAGGLATTVGLLLPWLLSRAGKDPAFGSGPLATIIQDVLSVLIYFFIAALLAR